jgi:hypothetical protein
LVILYIRHAQHTASGQDVTAKAFNLAREAQNLVFKLDSFIKTSFNMKKTYQYWPLNIQKTFLARQEN